MSEQPKKPGYKDTMNMPETPFPMKADLATREPARLEAWTQATALTSGYAASAPAAASRRSGNRTRMLGEGTSAYSISAMASAVRSVGHQWIARLPRWMKPRSCRRRSVSRISASNSGAIVR